MSNNPSNPFDVDPEIAGRLKDGINLGNAVELPFAAPVLWWLNGNPQNRALATGTPAVYYGGWAVNEDAFVEVEKERGIPAGMVKTDIYTRSNKTIATYTARLVVVAPFGYRRSWVATGANGQEVRTVEYKEGARQHVQLLAMLGDKQPDKTYLPWGPVVLSAKGYQAGYILDALKDWKKLLEPEVRKVAAALPAWAFYMGIGTFGREPEIEQKGKSGSQSPVTPLKLYKPEKIDEHVLQAVYVGRDALGEMVELLDQAQPWLKAWEKRGANGAAGSHDGEPEYDGFVPDSDPDLDIPF